MEDFSILAKFIVTDGRILMTAGSLDVFYLSAIVLIVAFLTARLMEKKHRSFFKSFCARSSLKNTGVVDRFFENNHIATLKKCPNCPERLPLSALICDACDYNFLSGMVARGQRMLPSPEPMTHNVSEPRFASAGL
jgi:hypothetical protein